MSRLYCVLPGYPSDLNIIDRQDQIQIQRARPGVDFTTPGCYETVKDGVWRFSNNMFEESTTIMRPCRSTFSDIRVFDGDPAGMLCKDD